jgi:hypothetical protein
VRARTAHIARIALGGLLVLLSQLSAWTFIDSFAAWSNGWMEGLSYALISILLLIIAALLFTGETGHPLIYWSSAAVVCIPCAWFVRWTWWLLTSAPEISPVPFFVPLLFAAGALVCCGVAAVLAHKARRTKRL